jgi:hypothetical protein
MNAIVQTALTADGTRQAITIPAGYLLYVRPISNVGKLYTSKTGGDYLTLTADATTVFGPPLYDQIVYVLAVAPTRIEYAFV